MRERAYSNVVLWSAMQEALVFLVLEESAVGLLSEAGSKTPPDTPVLPYKSPHHSQCYRRSGFPIGLTVITISWTFG